MAVLTPPKISNRLLSPQAKTSIHEYIVSYVLIFMEKRSLSGDRVGHVQERRE